MAEPTFQIPKEIITPIIQAHVNEAVLKALDGPQNIVSSAVLSIINTKVDENGKPCSYGSSRPWIDWMIGDAVKNAARVAVEKMVVEHQDLIQKQLLAELSKKNSPLIKQMVNAMVTGVTSAVQSKWNFNVSFGRND